MNEKKYTDIQIGFTVSFSRKISAEMEATFRAITGDENPLHFDDDFARSVGAFRSHATFGLLTASFYSTLAGVYLPGKYSLIHSFEDIKFLKPVYVDDILTISGEVKEKIDALKLIVVNAKIINQSGEKVSSAKIKILVLA